MKTHSILAAILLIAVINVSAEPEIKGTPTELSQYLNNVAQTVSLTGQSELKVAADRAVISLKVVTENKSLQDALQSNQELRARIQKTLIGRGFSTNRIQASKFSSTPQYGMFKEKAKSYRVENVIKVAALDEKEFQAVANVVDTISEVRYDSIEFEHSDKEALKSKALAEAIEKATERRGLYEEKLGVKLSPKRFVESNVGVAPVQQKGVRYGSYSSSESSRMITPIPAAADSGADLPSSFGEMVFTAQVTVEYALTAK
jgi:uncharacterized protein